MKAKVTVTEYNPLNEYSLKQFAAFAGGDQENLREILVSFISSGKKNAELFKQSIEDENVIMISELSHKMLPLYRQLEAKNIVGLLSQLEQKDIQSPGNEMYYSIAKSALNMIETLLLNIQKREEISLS